MVKAMRAVQKEHPIIIDLVKIGEDLGYEKGREEGLRTARQMLLDLLAARGIPPRSETRARIERETDLEVLRVWFQRAVVADSAESAIGD
jgi:hypothetical protein